MLAQTNIDRSTVVVPANELPPESALPGQLRERRKPPIVIGADGAEKQNLQHLPSEATLPVVQLDGPPVVPPEGADEEAKETLLRLNASEDKRPWLRIDQKAHIDRIRSIAFSEDSRRLFVAGDDKQVIVHQLGDDGTWNYERTIRWQVQRGPSGRIYCVASSGGMLAIGGRSATGSVGEIQLFQPATGQLVQTLVGQHHRHDDRLTSIAFSPGVNAPSLASMDQRGRLLHWTRNAETGIWSAQQLAEDEQHATERLLDRTLHPIAVVNNRLVAAPVAAGRTPQGAAKWTVLLYDTTDSSKNRLLLREGQVHVGMVTAMAASARAGRLASADESGQLFVWDLTKSAFPVRHELNAFATSLGFSRDGTTLAIGKSGPKRSVELWDVSDARIRRPIREDDVRTDVLACAISQNGKHLAYSQGADVVICNVGHRVQQSAVVRSPVPEPTRVAFSRTAPYRLAFSTRVDSTPVLETIFDPGKGQLDNSRIRQDDWFSPNEHHHGWSVKTDGRETWLEQNGQRRGTLPLVPNLHGGFKTACWIPRNNQPYAVAIGTYATEIYVYQLVNQGECPLIRKFRGHTGSVNSMCLSHDQRYLASCSTDRTICIWKLEGLGTDTSIDRWGTTFGIEDGEVIVQSIRDDGPLYFRGVRAGDQINSLIWNKPAAERPTAIEQSQAIMNRLLNGSADELTAFEYQRGRAPMSTFQSYPAWQPVATLIVDDKREWAFWTPSGFYDASFEGHKLFGWQVNRGPNVLPDFFLAAQVRGFLERPDILSNLLEAGSVEAAFRQQSVAAPANWSSVLAQQQALRPHVTILEPQPNQEVKGPIISVVANIDVKRGQSLVPPKAFANGVVGIRRELVTKQEIGDTIQHRYEWKVPIPSDSQLLIQVAAATEDETADLQSVKVSRAGPPASPPARMFVVTAGVNDYRDAQVPKLEFAAENALGVAKMLETGSRPQYVCEAITLLGDRVTRPTWAVTMESHAQILRADARPDDLLVIFLSGHGVRDEQTERYYYVPANARLADIRAGKYADCLSFEDLALFSDVPCRKLVILDTCHSGAIQPLRQRELKAALRALQDDVFLTLTASEGGQEAVEDGQRQYGRFTYRLLEALRGRADQADGNQDGVVALDEIIRYVQRTVAADSAAGPTSQHPMAGPSELIDLAEVPITTRQVAATVTEARRN